MEKPGPIFPTFSSLSLMHRREFDYGLHHDGGYLFFSRLSIYFALISAMPGGILVQLDLVSAKSNPGFVGI